ncbi:SseB family protein [Sanguibacter suaedae]|uniref:SseB family protein n=1 Tax=Sanguibacter suaedae TaxID=2795737 RepID=A0A934MES6_9MICO|nr:SseB family protein [Sanguibacter suaedae]MBI9115964.1 SseB family protein [Sanguibacter suaedae]
MAPTEPAVIDSLARKAVTATEEPESGARWSALWRRVLLLESWYFVRDGSEQLRPAAVKVDDKLAIPVFTDEARATAFAEDGHGGAERVFSSPPREMLSAAEQLSSSGIEVLVFNPQDAPFGAPPQVVRTLAENLDRARRAARGGQGAVGGGGGGGAADIPALAGDTLVLDDAPTIDALAAAARERPTEAAAQGPLWHAVLSLERWYFVPSGEGDSVKPLAVKTDHGPTVLAFTAPDRAAEFATARGLDNPERLLAVPVGAAVEWLSALGEAGVELVQFDTQHTAFAAPVTTLPTMLEQVSPG